MKTRTTPLLTTLLFALSLGLSPLIFAANPVYDDNYTYNGKRYHALSTGGVKKPFVSVRRINDQKNPAAVPSLLSSHRNVFAAVHLVYMTMIVIEASAGHNWSNMMSYPSIGIWNIASVSRNRIRNFRV